MQAHLCELARCHEVQIRPRYIVCKCTQSDTKICRIGQADTIKRQAQDMLLCNLHNDMSCVDIYGYLSALHPSGPTEANKKQMLLLHRGQR